MTQPNSPSPSNHSRAQLLLGLIVAGFTWSEAAAQSLPKVIKHRFDGLASDDHLGSSVAGLGDVDGDGRPDLAIGAPWTDPMGAIAAGTTYLHSGRTGRLLIRIDGEQGDRFGCSVDGAGDVNGDGKPDVVIGAENAFVPAVGYAGAASVWSGKSGRLLLGWTGQAFADGFGRVVGGAGDVDGDGRPDLIVGAPFSSPGGVQMAGAASVYSGANGDLLFELQGHDLLGLMGISVAGAGDVDVDGHDDVVIGEFYGGNGQGRVYVCSGATRAVLLQLDGQALNCDNLGAAVASAGDVDGDGRPDLVLGAPFTNPGPLGSAGTVLVYSVALQQVLDTFNGVSGDNLGAAVDGAGDVDGDGTPDIVVGAPGAQPNGKEEAGRAVVYSGKTGALLFSVIGKREFDHLGQSVSGLGDIDGDGRAEVLIGVPDSDFAGQDTGSVLVVGPQ